MNVIELWPTLSTCICGKGGIFDKAIPYYCEPVPLGHSNECYREACEACYLKWYYEIELPFQQSVENFEQKYFINESPKQ